MQPPPPISTHTDTLFPYPTRFRSWMRLIAGTAFGLTSSVKTHSPLFYLHVVLQPGARISLPQGHAERAGYIAKGRVATEGRDYAARSEEHTSELQSLMRISYAVFCLKTKKAYTND